MSKVTLLNPPPSNNLKSLLYTFHEGQGAAADPISGYRVKKVKEIKTLPITAAGLQKPTTSIHFSCLFSVEMSLVYINHISTTLNATFFLGYPIEAYFLLLVYFSTDG